MERRVSAANELRIIARKIKESAFDNWTYADDWLVVTPSRSSVKSYVCGDLDKRLSSIADRIDAEYVEVPVDRDGEPIKVGDTVYLGYGDVKYLVTGLSYDATSVSVHVARGLDVGWYSPENVSHKQRPDSFERIAAEIEGADVDGCSDWADRIRKLAKEERDD